MRTTSDHPGSSPRTPGRPIPAPSEMIDPWTEYEMKLISLYTWNWMPVIMIYDDIITIYHILPYIILYYIITCHDLP